MEEDGCKYLFFKFAQHGQTNKHIPAIRNLALLSLFQILSSLSFQFLSPCSLAISLSLSLSSNLLLLLSPDLCFKRPRRFRLQVSVRLGLRFRLLQPLRFLRCCTDSTMTSASLTLAPIKLRSTPLSSFSEILVFSQLYRRFRNSMLRTQKVITKFFSLRLGSSNSFSYD